MGSRPTIRDVAERAGVSKSLVSLALRGSEKVSPSSRAAIQQAITELGYRPNAAARTLADQRSRAIGVLADDLANPIYAEIVESAQPQFRERDYTMMLISGSGAALHREKELQRLLEFQVEGLMLITHDLPQSIIDTMSREVPVVVVTQAGVVQELAAFDLVTTDDEYGAQLAVDNLLAHGHQRIVHISGGDNDVSRARERGYRMAMSRAGLDEHIRVIPGGFSDSSGYQAARMVIESHPATAIFVANDFSAIGVLAALNEADIRVPRDMSVVGFDGVRLGHLPTINLTTIAQPLASLGDTAARVLCERIADPRMASRHITTPPELLMRGTVARAPERTHELIVGENI